ncbi:Uncharacterised protein [Mycobacteroides abscessus]|nr:Uncharacterised protein [Mycobacteroides abscessus]
MRRSATPDCERVSTASPAAWPSSAAMPNASSTAGAANTSARA